MSEKLSRLKADEQGFYLRWKCDVLYVLLSTSSLSISELPCLVSLSSLLSGYRIWQSLALTPFSDFFLSPCPTLPYLQSSVFSESPPSTLFVLPPSSPKSLESQLSLSTSVSQSLEDTPVSPLSPSYLKPLQALWVLQVQEPSEILPTRL